MLYFTIAALLVTYLAGYVHGRIRGKRLTESKVPTFLVRPHTEKTIQQYPLPEETPIEGISDAEWGRPELPNSGVRWS